MTATLAWMRLDLRRRWRSLVILALLIGVAGGAVITTFAGAHRGATSLDRLRDVTLPADAVVLPNDPDFDWAPFRDLDYVEAMSLFALGTEPVVEGMPSADALDFLHAYDSWGRAIERPVVLEGRLYDYEASDEAVMTPSYAEKHDREIGDVLTVHLTSPEQADSGMEQIPAEDYAGPTIEVTIVGVIRSPWYVDAPGSPGALAFSPGLFADYRDNFMGVEEEYSFLNAQFRLENGAADLPRLRGDVERITDRSTIDVWNSHDAYAEGQRTLDFEARCLLAFGIAALLAGLFLVGQAIARYAAAASGELRTGRALGMTPRQRVVAASAGPFIASLAGAGIAGAGSIVASSRFPIGTASGAEPSPGVHVDAVVLGAVALAVIVLATAGAAASAAMSLRASAAGAPRRSPVAAAVSSAGLPVPVVVGTRFALERGMGRAAVPVLPALVGAVVGVLGVIAAFSFSHAVDDAISHPERFGQTYQSMAFVGFNGEAPEEVDEVADVLRSLDYVTGVDPGRVGVATGPEGESSVALWSYEPGDKALPTVVSSGRMPESQDEVLLTPGALDELGKQVGDEVVLAGGSGTQQLMIVGAGFVPVGPHNSYNEGGFVTAHGYDTLFDDFKFLMVFVAVADHARDDGLSDRLTADVVAELPDLAAMGPLFSDPGEAGLDVSQATGQLKQIRVLPVALGIFLALLAIGAVGHAIATATRRRAHQLAVLRAVGMTQWQCRGVVLTQATVLVLVGLVFGVPIGLAIGRSVWHVVADYTPLAYFPPTAILVLALVGPVALLVAYAVAAWPAMRSSGLRIAHVLRAE